MFNTFYIIFLSGAVMYLNNNDPFLILSLILSLFFLLKTGKIEKNFILFFCLLGLLIILTCVFNTDTLKFETYFGFLIRLIYSMSFVLLFSLEDFMNNYLKVMAFLASFSLVFYFLGLVLPDSLNNLDLKIITDYASYYGNAYLYVYRYPYYRTNFLRNNSIFWEPGAYQAFLNLAIIFELKHEKPNSFRMAIFIVSLITTFSTTGYITFLLITLKSFFEKSNNSKKTFLILLITLIFILTIFNEVMINKLSTNNLSFSRRILDAKIDLKIFSENPLLGVGYNNYSKLFIDNLKYSIFSGTSSSNSITNTLAVFGLVFTFLIFYLYIRFILFFENNIFSRLFLFLILLSIFSTENFMVSSLWMVLAFYGLKNANYKNQNSNYLVKQ